MQIPKFALMLILAISMSAPCKAADKIDGDALAATRNGASARVLVMLHEAPSALRAHEAISLRIERIQTEVDDVLTALPSDRYALRRRFQSVPAFAIDIDRDGLLALQAHPRVLSIGLDLGGTGAGSVAPDAASVLNQVSPLQSLGLGGSGMKVAVIDSGVDTDHADFSGRIVAQQ